jgi:hypothetical protein
MIRTFLGVGDRAGEALITEGLPGVTCSNPPPRVNISTIYMKTWCNACKKEGYIAPRGPRWPGTGPNGKEWALSGDINVCDCSPPPVFYAERNMTMTFTSEQASALVGGKTAIPATKGARDAFDQHFRLTDQRTGQPLRDTPYRIVTDDGEEFEGRTDSQGHTLRVSSSSAIGATLHVIADEPLIDPDWDKYL